MKKSQQSLEWLRLLYNNAHLTIDAHSRQQGQPQRIMTGLKDSGGLGLSGLRVGKTGRAGDKSKAEVGVNGVNLDARDSTPAHFSLINEC